MHPLRPLHLGHHLALLIQDLRLSTAVRVLLDGAVVRLHRGDRAALIGSNGSGKSTLLSVVAAAAGLCQSPPHAFAAGTVRVPGGAGYLPQSSPGLGAGLTVAEHLERAFEPRARCLHRFQLAAAALAAAPADGALALALANATDAVTAADAWTLNEERDQLLGSLVGGIDPGRGLDTLSGGEVTRVALAGVIAARPGLLLLDEPTNSLDAAGVAVLVDWIRRTEAAVLLVSHDRDLLDAVATSVIEILPGTSRLRQDRGNHADHVERRRVDDLAQLRQVEQRDRERRRLIEDSRRLQERGDRFQGQSHNDYYRARGRKVARRAVVQASRVERRLVALDGPPVAPRPRLEVTSAPASAATLLRLHGVSVRHPLASADTLESVSLGIRGGERVAVVGANGAGKSTLLALLSGDLRPRRGQVFRALAGELRLLRQSPPASPPGQPVLEWARRIAPVSEEEAQVALGGVLFSAVLGRTMGELSDGERRRVQLALLFAGAPAVVLLDEPTNHLDLETIEMVEDAVDRYRGSLVVASHDRRFLVHCRPDTVVGLEAGRLVRVVVDARTGADSALDSAGLAAFGTGSTEHADGHR